MSARVLVLPLVVVLASCAPPPRPTGVDGSIAAEVEAAGKRKQLAPPPAVDQALLPRPQMEMPELKGQALDQRFDLSVNNAPAAQVFNSIVAGTRYSMLVHPGVSGTLSLNLKDVTIREALEAVREIYGYDFRIEGTRIFIQSAGLQTRIFQVSYLPGQRRGLTDVRVQSGAVTDAGPGTAGGAAGAATGTGAPASRSLESSRVTTQQQSDFWGDLRSALTALVAGDGRSVIVTPQSGVVVVRGLPHELRSVEQYLRATKLSVERQVMLEAKIVEVTLSDGFQAGINWAAFRNSGPNLAAGQFSSSGAPPTATQLGTRGQILGTGAAPNGLVVDAAGRTAVATAGSFAGANPAGAVFGLALQTSNFALLLNFLESQGNVQVLSSPRLATINNQKAVLKVGTDEFFVTNVTSTATTTGAATTTSPSVTVQPFFSGIVLDVTPQIDDASNIILHIHPSVSEVTESTRVVNLGGQIAELRLPLAKSTVSETDTIVRVTDGNIVAIGGLMSVDIRDNRGGLPGAPDGLRNTSRTLTKKELVILLKPTVIESDREWERDLRETRERLDGMSRQMREQGRGR
jgi:MSHA biogenesis protein MshL